MAFWMSNREKKLEEKIFRMELQLKHSEKELDIKRQEFRLEHEKKIAEVERLALDQASLVERESKAKLKKMELDHQSGINQLKSDYETKMNLERERLNGEFYARLSSGLEKLHSEGNAQTKFVQEIALKMADVAPKYRAQLDINTGKGKK